MNIILNIGLPTNVTQFIAAHVTREIVKANGLVIHKSAVYQSDTEPTLVVTARLGPFVHGVPLSKRVYQMAVDLEQECIAVWLPQGLRSAPVGALVGPRAADWGVFDPTLFIMPDGKRLAQSQVAQAA